MTLITIAAAHILIVILITIANADIRIHKALPCYDTAVSYSPGVVLIDDRCIVEPLLDHALWDID